MSNRELRVYKVEDEEGTFVLHEECAEWIREGYQLKVEEVIAGVFKSDVCQHCGRDD